MERSGNPNTNMTGREEIGHGEYENRKYGMEHKYGTEHSDSESSHQHYESSLCSDLDSSSGGHKRTTSSSHQIIKSDDKSSSHHAKVDGNGINTTTGSSHEGSGSYGSMDKADGRNKTIRMGTKGYTGVHTGKGNAALMLVSELSKSMEKQYYSDVNTALQAVEER